MSLQKHCSAVRSALGMELGARLASLLALDQPTRPALVQAARAMNNARAFVLARVKGKFGEVLAGVLLAMRALEDGEVADAYTKYHAAFLSMAKAVAEQTTLWSLPVLYQFCTDLRLLATQADKVPRGAEEESPLQSAERLLKGRAYAMTYNDRTPMPNSRKFGTVHVVNTLFRMYFAMDKLRLCDTLIKQLETNKRFPSIDQFPLAHSVTYQYFAGRLALYEDNYERAEQCLGFAFEHCHHAYKKNKRLILRYLVPVRMLRGVLPSRALLQRYNLLAYADVCDAVRRGDLRAFDALMEQHQNTFIAHSVYLALDKVRGVVMRTLFLRTFKVLNTTRLALPQLQAVLRWAGEDLPMDEVECVVANLIYAGLIRGYLSHGKLTLVLSKKEPFPAVHSVAQR